MGALGGELPPALRWLGERTLSSALISSPSVLEFPCAFLESKRTRSPGERVAGRVGWLLSFSRAARTGRGIGPSRDDRPAVARLRRARAESGDQRRGRGHRGRRGTRASSHLAGGSDAVVRRGAAEHLRVRGPVRAARANRATAPISRKAPAGR